jgi:sortase A
VLNIYMDNKSDDQQKNAAADLIRAKLDKLYKDEPDASEELEEVEAKPQKSLSKHQRFMRKLHDSGKDIAEIQTAWHEYYSGLPDSEKHEVWQEFYSEHEKAKTTPHKPQSKPEYIDPKVITPPHQVKHVYGSHEPPKKPRSSSKSKDKRLASEIKGQIIDNVQSRAAIKDNHHFRSLVFGLSMGLFVVFILMFSFFNERFITPFIRPSQNVSATPIIVDPNAAGPVSPENKIIIPKINVEAPVVYDIPTIEEKDVQAGLERGVVHYITTPNPGEKGNSVIFGHSSSNILNKGKYKFAFLLLKSLEKDDTFIVQKDGKRYVYKIYNKFVTSPTDFSVVGPTDRPATMTLITCDPPGTSTNRLIIQAEQIFPDPATNAESSVPASATGQPEQLPSNSPSLWSRIWSWL